MMGHKMPKAKIRTVLQTMDEVNRNNRIYPQKILERAITDVDPLIKNRTLLGELDHPVVTGNDQADAYRHFVVLYEKVSHIIEDVKIEGNTIYATVETCLTDNGFKMAGLIMDKVPVGFSLRAIGETRQKRGGILEIKDPFNIITYDCVSNPSHASARMTQVVGENVNSWLSEGSMVSLNNNDGTVCCDRSNVLVECMNRSNDNKLENIVERLEKNINQNRLVDAERNVDSILSGYLSESQEYRTSSIEDFLDAHINGNEPLQALFDKYLA